MGRHRSDDSDSERKSRKKKKRRARSRSRSSEASDSSKYSSTKVKKSKKRSRKSSRSRSRSPDRRRLRRSRSRSGDRYVSSRGRSHSRSPDYRSRRRSRTPSYSRSRRSRSRGRRSRTHSRERRSRSRDRRSRDRRSRSQSNGRTSSRRLSPETDSYSISGISTDRKLKSEDVEERMRLALKAAALADEQLRHTETNASLALGVLDRTDFADSVAEIDSGSFVASTFSSSRATKVKEEPDLRPSHDDAIFGSLSVTGFTLKPDPDMRPVELDADSIMHPSLYCDPDEKMDRWIQRLSQLRKRKLEGDAM